MPVPNLNNPESHHFNEVTDLGVAICLMDKGPQRHVGLLYKSDKSDALVLHLLSHMDLRSEPPRQTFRWMQVDLDEINRRNLVGLCHLIASKKYGIPFGFSYNGKYLTPEGNYVGRALGEGLTCATFIMAVFNTYSLPVLNLEQWARREDDALWQMDMVSMLRKKHGNVVAEYAARSLGDIRFRPEEVAAGAVDKDRPLEFPDAEAKGKGIVDRLYKSYGMKSPK